MDEQQIGESKGIVGIIEDDPALRNILKGKFVAKGFAVCTTGDGAEAIAVIQEHKPSVIILDLMLPNKTGEEILEEMKADSELANIAVIIFSNRGDDEDIEKLKGMGADEYLVKANTLPDEIVELVGEYVNSER